MVCNIKLVVSTQTLCLLRVCFINLTSKYLSTILIKQNLAKIKQSLFETIQVNKS